MVKKLGVDSLPALVGWTSNGEKHILKTGVSVKDLKSAVHDLSGLLDGLEKKNKKAGSTSRKQQTEPLSPWVSSTLVVELLLVESGACKQIGWQCGWFKILFL